MKRAAFGFFSGERLIAHNLVVVGGTFAAGTLGVAFQSLVSHQLRPSDYGAVFSVVTLITSLGLPAGAFTLLMARQTSHARASGNQAASASLLRRGNHALTAAGLALAVALSAGSPLLSSFLQVPAQLLLAAAVGIPFGLALPLLMGELQGEQRFGTYAALSTGQAALKLIGAIVLGLALGPVGVIVGISLATILMYAIALRLVRRKLSIRASIPWFGPAASYLAVVLPSALMLAMLLSADVVLVKHYFPARVAGDYAAVAAIGRAVFWGASGVAIVLFPKVAYRTAQGRGAAQLVASSLALVALGGLAGLVLLSFASSWLLSMFAGSAYTAGAAYLPLYAVGMTLLGGVAVLVATHQSRGKAGFLGILIPLAVLEPVLIIAFHQSLLQVVQMVDLSMCGVGIALAIWYLVDERDRQSTIRATAPAPLELAPATQVQVNQ